MRLLLRFEIMRTLGIGHLRLVGLYYSVYHVAKTLLLDRNIEVHTHMGMIRLNGMNFVNEEILTKEDERLLSHLFDMHQTGDYGDFIKWTEEDVSPLFDKALELIQKMESLILSKWI